MELAYVKRRGKLEMRHYSDSQLWFVTYPTHCMGFAVNAHYSFDSKREADKMYDGLAGLFGKEKEEIWENKS